jgi:hypothetical protein
MIVLRISAYNHDSAAALVQDGVIVAAAQEERFTRKKHDADFPANAARWCLANAGITGEQVDRMAFYDKPGLDGDDGQAKGWHDAKAYIAKLSAFTKAHGTKLLIASLPELHDVQHYRCRRLPIWYMKRQTRTASPLSTCCPMSKGSPHRSSGSLRPIQIPMVLRIDCLPREYSKLWKNSASTKPLSSAKLVEKVDIS